MRTVTTEFRVVLSLTCVKHPGQPWNSGAPKILPLPSLASMYTFNLLFKKSSPEDTLIDFEVGRGREINISCLSGAPWPGPDLQPRHVPWPNWPRQGRLICLNAHPFPAVGLSSPDQESRFPGVIAPARVSSPLLRRGRSVRHTQTLHTHPRCETLKVVQWPVSGKVVTCVHVLPTLFNSELLRAESEFCTSLHSLCSNWHCSVHSIKWLLHYQLHEYRTSSYETCWHVSPRTCRLSVTWMSR